MTHRAQQDSSRNFTRAITEKTFLQGTSHLLTPLGGNSSKSSNMEHEEEKGMNEPGLGTCSCAPCTCPAHHAGSGDPLNGLSCPLGEQLSAMSQWGKGNGVVHAFPLDVSRDHTPPNSIFRGI
jgi:hypothetical protein